MAFTERIQELDKEIGAAVERALAELRRELAERLRSGSEAVVRQIEQFEPTPPALPRAEERVAPLAQELAEELAEQRAGERAASARQEARREAAAGLRDALAAIDRARSQTEILNALLAEAGRFASRSAVLLSRAGEVRGWGGHGFDQAGPAVRDLALSYPAGSSWERFAQGGGTVRLSPAECADLCSRLESTLPREGVVVPIVLRDRVAAGLYADRVDGAELGVEALQVLAYAAAQAIETLPFRERASTPTLYPVAEAAESPAGPAPQPAVAAPEPAPMAAAAAKAVAAPEPEAAELEVMAEPVAAEPAFAPEEAPAEDYRAFQEAGAPWSVEEPTSELTALPELPDTETATTAVAEPELAELPAVATTAIAEPAPGPAKDEEPAAPAAAAPAAGAETVLLPPPDLREPIPSPFLPSELPAPAEPAADPGEDTHPGMPRPVAAPAFGAPLPGGDLSASGTVEVRPPTGVEGPGWAFAKAQAPVAPSDETMHEEARRLARLLVSEIKLYNEEQVEEGRRNRDLYERLREDIDRSRQMYEERVDPRILRSTDYFYQELVRILAAGDSRTLGI